MLRPPLGWRAAARATRTAEADHNTHASAFRSPTSKGMKRGGEKTLVVSRNKADGEMRRLARSFFGCLLLSVALAVAGREAPELASLSDDVSNDGVIVSGVCEAEPSIKRHKVSPGCFGGALPTLSRQVTRNPLPAFATSLAGQSLRQLLCVQRK